MPSLSQYLFLLATVLSSSLAGEVLHPDTRFEVPVYNDLAHQRYNISIALGTPPQTFALLFDTGSSDVWVPKPNSSGCTPNCPTGFDPTTSSSIVNLSIPFDARYGLTPDLAVLGSYYNDTISVSGIPALPNARFAIGDIPLLLFSTGYRGIFGLGSRLNEAAYSGGPTSLSHNNFSATYTPLWERLALQSPTKQRKFSVWLNEQGAEQGSVLFGGEDANKYDGTLQTLPLNLQDGKVGGWSVNVTGVNRVHPGGQHGVATKTCLTPANYSLDYIFDTGSPNMYVPTALYTSIVTDLNATGIINGAPYVPCSLRSTLTDYLEFEFLTRAKARDGRQRAGTAKIRVPYTEIIYPFGYPVTVPLVKDVNGAKMCYFGVVPTDGFIRLLGATFVRSAYVVFDADNLEVRIAQAKWAT